MALIPHSFDLGYIMIISFREKLQRQMLAGYCPWTILFEMIFKKKINFRAASVMNCRGDQTRAAFYMNGVMT